MKRFSQLFTQVDQTTKTSLKVKALSDYFQTAPEQDRLWAIALFSGRRPKRSVTTTRLREWAAEAAHLPLWLLEECYPVVGDLAETLALILPPPTTRSDQSLSQTIAQLRALAQMDEDARKTHILAAWDGLDQTERLIFNKLITGGFRIGISQKLMTRALAQATGREEADLAHRLMGDWSPDTTDWHSLVLSHDPGDSLSRPYPFCLAHGLDAPPEDLGPREAWQAEWKWDGIRAQLIVRGGMPYLWSRGEELITPRFPELATAADWLPDGTVLDGELVAWDGRAPMSFGTLQTRITRKTVPKKLLAEAPVILLAYDLLEQGGKDLRGAPLEQRRRALDALVRNLPKTVPIRASQPLPVQGWPELAQLRQTSRDHKSEGIMLKRVSSPYHTGRKRGDWWKWKLDPLTIDAVMIYAQAGHGRRATLFTDFTFAVWSGNDLVPFTKAYSGLTDAEFRQITQWVRKNTQERFGPVRRVTPAHVFEIAFEGLQASPRHKSGVALRFPRMARWRHDLSIDQADTLDHLKGLLAQYG